MCAHNKKQTSTKKIYHPFPLAPSCSTAVVLGGVALISVARPPGLTAVPLLDMTTRSDYRLPGAGPLTMRRVGYCVLNTQTNK